MAEGTVVVDAPTNGTSDVKVTDEPVAAPTFDVSAWDYSSLPEKVRAILGALIPMIVSARAAVVDASPWSGLVSAMSKVLGAYKVAQDAVSVPDDMSAEQAEALKSLPDVLKVAIGTVNAFDRAEGDALARKLAGAIDFGAIEGTDAETALKVIDAWNGTGKSARGGRGGGSGSSKESLGFGINAKCEACGWSAVDRTGINSGRWGVTGHLMAKHGHSIRPGKGSPLWQGITDAMTAVKDGAQSAQGGGFIFDRVA